MTRQNKSATQKMLSMEHTLNKPQQNNTDVELKPFVKQGNMYKK